MSYSNGQAPAKTMVTTDQGRIQRILDPLFLQAPVKIMANGSKSTQAQVHSIENASVHVEHGLGEAQSYILMAEHKGYDFFLKCDALKHMRSGSLLQAVRALIKPSLRKEERHAIEEGNAPIISKLMLFHEFLASFAVLDGRRDKQIALSKKALRELLPDKVGMEFLLRKSSHMNLRLRSLDRLRLPIFVPDKNSAAQVSFDDEYQFMPFSEYEKILRTESWNKSFISEICEPLRYRNELTFGYIRLHSLEPFTPKDYQIVHHIARKLENFIENSPNLPLYDPVDARILDISHNGLAFVCRFDKELYQKMQNDETIIFGLQFPGKKPLAYTAKIRSGFQQGPNLRFGLEFVENTREQQSAIDNYISENTSPPPLP